MVDLGWSARELSHLHSRPMLESENIEQAAAGHPGGAARREGPLAGSQMVAGTLHQKSDDALITLFQNGEPEGFRVLVERYQERVRNLIYSIFHEKELVDDLAQEVFVRVYEALPTFRFQSSFYTWLYRIVINRSRDELRRRRVRRFFSLQAVLDSSDAELKNNMIVEQYDTEPQELVAKALQRLPEKFRIAVILKDINGLSYEEMAEAMDCEIGTVKSRLSRGRTMLRDLLKPLIEEK
jgi:RNA polymerase sigma-70 factor (ECF subfamily)